MKARLSQIQCEHENSILKWPASTDNKLTISPAVDSFRASLLIVNVCGNWVVIRRMNFILWSVKTIIQWIHLNIYVVAVPVFLSRGLYSIQYVQNCYSHFRESMKHLYELHRMKVKVRNFTSFMHHLPLTLMAANVCDVWKQGVFKRKVLSQTPWVILQNLIMQCH